MFFYEKKTLSKGHYPRDVVLKKKNTGCQRENVTTGNKKKDIRKKTTFQSKNCSFTTILSLC